MSRLRFLSEDKLREKYGRLTDQLDMQVTGAGGSGQNTTIGEKSVAELQSLIDEVIAALQWHCPGKYGVDTGGRVRLDFRKSGLPPTLLSADVDEFPPAEEEVVICPPEVIIP